MANSLKIKGYLPASIWALFIFILIIFPKHNIPRLPDWDISVDKLVHFGLFVVLILLILFGGKSKGKEWTRSLRIQVILLLFFYGLMLELLQLVVPDRNFSLIDLFSDLLGAITGNFLFDRFVKPKQGLGQ